MEDCTLLLNSYDGGADLWEGFFTALTYQWKQFDLPVVLNTETKKFDFKSLNIKTVNCPNKNIPWGKRLIDCLKQIDTEYVLFFLDDFWLEAPVDNEYFEKCRQYMRDNPDVACISFQRTRGENIKDGRFERFEKRPQKNAPYKFNCQSALWRKEKLISYIRPHESPWEWELLGSKRANRYNDSFYSLIEEKLKVFSYDLGGVVYKGRWCKAVVLPLAEKYGLKIDFEKRGFWEDFKALNVKRKRNLWRDIKNRWHKLKSLI